MADGHKPYWSIVAKLPSVMLKKWRPHFLYRHADLLVSETTTIISDAWAMNLYSSAAYATASFIRWSRTTMNSYGSVCPADGYREAKSRTRSIFSCGTSLSRNSRHIRRFLTTVSKSIRKSPPTTALSNRALRGFDHKPGARRCSTRWRPRLATELLSTAICTVIDPRAPRCMLFLARRTPSQTLVCPWRCA